MYQNIIVALDASDEESAGWALQHVRYLAQSSDATIHLVHVRLRLPKTYVRYMPPAWDREDRQTCLEWLNKQAAALGLPEERCELHAPQGSIAEKILELAQEVGAELIVLGSHAPSLGRKLFGSNASAVVRDSMTSVLVARPPGQGD